MSYLTAWLKVHYPLEFLTSCLIAEIGTDKITSILNEAQRIGIKISNPDINLSNDVFTPNKDKNEILYGFSAINGFTKNSTRLIIENRPFSSYVDFIERVSLSMNKSDVISLIKSGAFNNLCDKDKMLLFKKYFSVRFDNGKENTKPISRISKTHIKWLIDNGYITIEQSNDKDYCLNILNKSRKTSCWEKFQEDYLTGSQLEWEMDTMNSFISGSPFDNVLIPEWDSVCVGDVGYVGGTVISVKNVAVKKEGKNKGKKMAFVNISMNDKIYDVVVFPDAYQRYNHIISNGACIVCTLNKQGDFKGSLNSCETLQEYLERTAQIQTQYK